jgi:hypothetical protein
VSGGGGEGDGGDGGFYSGAGSGCVFIIDPTGRRAAADQVARVTRRCPELVVCQLFMRTLRNPHLYVNQAINGYISAYLNIISIF